jgi:hypothetical protein
LFKPTLAVAAEARASPSAGPRGLATIEGGTIGSSGCYEASGRLLQHPSGPHRIRYGEHPPAEIGDPLTIDGTAYVVIAKEPPFEQRRLERLVCTHRLLPGKRESSSRPNCASRTPRPAAHELGSCRAGVVHLPQRDARPPLRA